MRLLSRSSDVISRLLPTESYDIGIAELPIDETAVRLTRYRMRCVAILPAKHALSPRKVLTPLLLSGHPVVAPARTLQTSVRVLKAFADVGAEWNPVAEAEFFASVCGLVSSGAGFDLSTGPLMRFTLIRTGPARHVLVQTVHHIIADGWSVPPMLRALLAEYHAPGTVRPRGGFADYVRWLAERDDAESDRVWREELAGLSGPSLVADGHVPSGRFAETTAKLEAVRGVPLSVVVHSAWAMTLGGILQSQDVVFGSTRAGRDSSGSCPRSRTYRRLPGCSPR